VSIVEAPPLAFSLPIGLDFNAKQELLLGIFLATGAGILATIAGTFSGGVGTIGIVTYHSSVSYYASLGYDISTYMGFLLLGVFALISSVFGVAGGMLALTRKRFKFSVLGILLVLASALFTFIVIEQYQYGYTDIIMLSEISIAVFSLASAILVVKSKNEFT
jgi:hypothetical protein